MRRHPWLRLALALALWILLGALVLAFRDLAQVVVARLARLLWAAHLLFQSIPRWALWTALLALALLLALRSLAPPRHRRDMADEEPPPATGPIAAELRYIRLAEQGRYGQWRLAQRLAELAAQALAYRDRIPPTEARQRIHAGTADLPEGLRRYLHADLGSIGASRRGLLASLRRGLAPPPAATPRTAALPPEADQAIAFIEELLEVKR